MVPWHGVSICTCICIFICIICICVCIYMYMYLCKHMYGNVAGIEDTIASPKMKASSTHDCATKQRL